ncbi:4175_t:CDS:2, partial [Ambispora gerdemannii]
QQTQQKKRKSRFQKHLRKPQSFNSYLLRRSNSTSSTSSCESSVRRISSTIRFAGLLDGNLLHDDVSSVSYSSSNNSADDWDPRDDEDEEEEDFFYNNGDNNSHRC